jgi:hypothetical protein
MTPPAATPPTIFQTTRIAPDDPLLERPVTKLSLDLIVEAARIVTEHPTVAGIQKFRQHVVSLRITPEEFEEMLNFRATVRMAEIAHAPASVYRS